jgi:uncharacterized alkaline shock family protein YloU
VKVISLIGPSGTGKSHRATWVAQEEDADAIIDDGLLIQNGKIMAGSSAKKEDSRIKAVKRAIFLEPKDAEGMRLALSKVKIKKLLILGTSEKMVGRIINALELPTVDKWIQIEEIATPEEMEKAKKNRMQEGKHVIPVPVIELKPHFTGYWIDSLQVLFRRKGRFSAEKSIVRPKFSYHGTLTISNTVIQSIAQYVTQMEEGVVKAEASSASVQKLEEKVLHIKIQIAAKHGILLVPLCKNVQEKVKTMIEYMTGMTVEKVDVSVKSLVVVP